MIRHGMILTSLICLCFFPYTCRNSTNLLIYNQKMPKILLFNAFALLCREWKMSQITHFCGVKYLAWKSGGVKFWTNIMSDQNVEHIYCRCWHFGNNQDLRPRLSIGQNSGLLYHLPPPKLTLVLQHLPLGFLQHLQKGLLILNTLLAAFAISDHLFPSPKHPILPPLHLQVPPTSHAIRWPASLPEDHPHLSLVGNHLNSSPSPGLRRPPLSVWGWAHVCNLRKVDLLLLSFLCKEI